MYAIIPTIALLLLVILPGNDAGAAIYTYKDDNGRTVFVDDEQKIPTRFRVNTRTIQEQRDQPVPNTEEGGTQGEPVEPPAQAVVDRNSQMRARQQVEMLDRERIYQTPVMVRGNRVLVPVEIAVGSQISHLMLLLDTGATSTGVHRASVKELSFQPGEQFSARVAGGRTVKFEKVVTRYLEIGPFEMRDFPVMLFSPQATNLPFDGMLGMDFLKDHPHTIDYDNEMIRWATRP